MLVLLPAQREGLPKFESSLTEARVRQLTSKLESERVQVSLPRFRIEDPSALSLTKDLAKLGFRTAFDRETADFTGIATPDPSTGRIFIDNILHKATVKIDEIGAEATAATAVLQSAGVSLPEGSPKEFRADHPFLFMIRDKRSGAILFMGRVTNPAS
jgi:serpin B